MSREDASPLNPAAAAGEPMSSARVDEEVCGSGGITCTVDSYCFGMVNAITVASTSPIAAALASVRLRERNREAIGISALQFTSPGSLGRKGE
jgi:hypothetical protein